MSIFLVALLLFQGTDQQATPPEQQPSEEHQHEEGHQHAEGHAHESDGRFSPITPGNDIYVGNFILNIPNNTFYADESNVHHMFHLAGQEFIPNCVGMFFSQSANWNYSVTVQYMDFQPVVMEPPLSEQDALDIFTKTHLHYMVPFDGIDAVMVYPPEYDRSEENAQNFTVGFRYIDKDGQGAVYLKKLWISSEEAMLFSLQATEQAYVDHEKELNAILASVRPNENPTFHGVPQGNVFSYLEILGLSPKKTEMEVVSGPSATTLIFSALLGVFSIALLAMAIYLKKQQEQQSADKAEEAS